jgi:hypothetical protein
MSLFFSLASVSRISGVPAHLISRFEIWEKVILVVFKKGHKLRPRFLSKKSFYLSFVEDRQARSRSITVTKNAFADKVFTARNESNDHAYTVIVSDVVDCQCADYRAQIAFGGRGCCKHGYAVLRSLGFSSLSDWQTIERMKRPPAPAHWPTAPRERSTIVNGRSID